MGDNKQTCEEVDKRLFVGGLSVAVSPAELSDRLGRFSTLIEPPTMIYREVSEGTQVLSVVYKSY